MQMPPPQGFPSMQPNQEMDVPEVDKRLLEELEGMGFPLARAARALHYCGDVSLEAAVNWIIDHENDPDIDEMPLVAVNIDIESPPPTQTPEEIQLKAQELSIRERARKKKEDEEKKLEQEREKERIRAGKELLAAKRIAEENERKCNIALRKAEKEEEKRARERVRMKLEADKAERRNMLGLSSKYTVPVKPSSAVPNERKNPLAVSNVTKAVRMRECLRSLRLNHKDNDYKVKGAFNTLLIYVRNVTKNPSEEKYRKIRVSNPLFQDRVASLQGGIEFLELCGFERTEGGQFLYLPRNKIDLAVLNSAGGVLMSAITNPFFGLLGKQD